MYTLQACPDFASFAVHIVLEELGVPYSLNLLDFDAGDLASPEHLAVNPFGKIPALQTPDGPMFETAAILLWLADRHGAPALAPALAPAPDAPGRSLFLSWFFFNAYSIHAGMMDLVHAYRPAGEANAAAASEVAFAKLTQQLAIMDTFAAREMPGWLSPAQPSILTYHLAMLMRWMNAFPFLPQHSIKPQNFPALHAILVAMEQRPAAIRAAAAEGMTGTFFSNPQG